MPSKRGMTVACGGRYGHAPRSIAREATARLWSYASATHAERLLGLCTIEKRVRVDVGGISAISSTQRNRMLQARTPRPCRLVMQGQLAVCVTPQKDDPGWGVGISGTTTIANVCDKTNPIWFVLSRPCGLKTLIRTQLRLVCPDVNETTAPQVETHQQGQWGIPKCHGLHWYAVHQLRRAQDRL